MPATLRVKPGLLKRVREMHRLPSDDALAQAIGVSRATLVRVDKEEIPPSPAFMAGLVGFTGLGLGEAFEIAQARPSRQARPSELKVSA
ncbi:hypothetical protein QM716_01420 [Rhodococcus sp. IEGM 1409]|uniref:hypothetical protein n=1 Tax=Rhodococcus sp. IEGM 1409 TaxID=3047082 RepID=UPI0024B8215F|nr:hypothetical protein [Rhodococcus sp. IEGM 1409]MDI9898508.1 hypothetical protein [Rhodococcus sp. IEGM 1409]